MLCFVCLFDYSTFNRNFHDCMYIQLMGETILLVGSISLGLVAYLVADIRLRRAFLDTRQSFEMRLTIESQAREQVKSKSLTFNRKCNKINGSFTHSCCCDDPKNTKQKKEQLLLSVLPEHVAVKMRQDLGTAHDGQFKKIYMSRHENVRLVLLTSFSFFFELNVYFIRW